MILLLAIVAIMWLVARPSQGPGLIRIKHKEWTRFENGAPVCGVGYRGYWTTKATIGGPWPFRQRDDGTWYDPKTGKDCVVMNLKEFLERP